MDYISVEEFAKKMKLSPKTVYELCSDSKISGAIKTNRAWKIPDDAEILQETPTRARTFDNQAGTQPEQSDTQVYTFNQLKSIMGSGDFTHAQAEQYRNMLKLMPEKSDPGIDRDEIESSIREELEISIREELIDEVTEEVKSSIHAELSREYLNRAEDMKDTFEQQLKDAKNKMNVYIDKMETEHQAKMEEAIEQKRHYAQRLSEVRNKSSLSANQMTNTLNNIRSFINEQTGESEKFFQFKTEQKKVPSFKKIPFLIGGKDTPKAYRPILQACNETLMSQGFRVEGRDGRLYRDETTAAEMDKLFEANLGNKKKYFRV